MNECEINCTGRNLTPEESALIHEHANPYNAQKRSLCATNSAIADIAKHAIGPMQEVITRFPKYGLPDPQTIHHDIANIRVACDHCPKRMLATPDTTTDSSSHH